MESEERQPSVIGRLAPSPTGALHLGNARSFLLAWLSVRQQHGRVILRIEDIDSPRVKPWAIDATIDDLRWLGLDWDAGPDMPASSVTAIPLVQSHRITRYVDILRQLIATGHVYRCYCSRSDVARAASAPHGESLHPLEGQVYPGTCRDRASSDQSTAGNKFAFRWAFKDGEVCWSDQLQGNCCANPARQLGDFIIARSDATGAITPAYQLAVVVDDHDAGISEVIRGDDLIYSTYRQLAILNELHWAPPIYSHVPLIVGPDGRRLAKRHGDTRLSFFREQGISAPAIVGYLAWTIGILAKPERISPTDLVGQLDWNQTPHEPTVFDLKDGLRVLRKLC